MKSPNPPRVCRVSLIGLNAFAQTFEEHLDFPRAPEYFRVLYGCASSKYRTLESYCNHGKLRPDSLLVHLSNCSHNEMTLLCNRFFEMSFRRLIQAGWKSDRVVVAIDTNDVEHWGVPDEFTHKGIGKKKKGTSKVYRYATITIVSRDFYFTLACIQTQPGDRLHDTVRRLLTLASSIVKIDLVLLDRGFYNGDVFTVIEEMGLTYLVHAKKSPVVDNLYEQVRKDGTWHSLYMMNRNTPRRKTIKLYFGEHEKYEYIVMVSNQDVATGDIRLLFETYRDRWGIENTYRDSNHFKIKTTSKNHAYRLLIYCLSHLYINLIRIIRIFNQACFAHYDLKDLLEKFLSGATGRTRISRSLIIIF